MFSFTLPWLLTAFLALPLVWWLLRVMPPRPRTVKFPAFFLLDDLATDIKSPAKTPWWLLLLRLLAVICLILALADPVLRMERKIPGFGGTALVVIDNGWSAAASWDARIHKVREYMAQLRREKRTVMLLPTAPSATDGRLHAAGVMDAAEAEAFLSRLSPQPWPTDRAAAIAQSKDILAQQNISHVLYFSDGLDDEHLLPLVENLRSGGGVTFFDDAVVNNPHILRRAEGESGTLAFTLERLRATSSPVELSLTGYAANGGVIDGYKFSFPAGARMADVTWDLVKEKRGDVARVALDAPQMAAAVWLSDAQWQQHPVGIVTAAADPGNQGFLNEAFYLTRALAAGGRVDTGTVENVLKQPVSAVIWPDSAVLTAAERMALLNWVEEEGGFLIRFAGPNLAAASADPLLPVPLRQGQRAMQGAMTWEKPVALGGIPVESPLAGLAVPKDVSVARQVLADPVPEVFEKSWLQLDDGTPLMTGGKLGRGTVALIHTTAGPDWSDFCYSGLYVEALQRMVSLGAGISGFKAQAILPPIRVLDGLGRLAPAARDSAAGAYDPKKDFIPSPATPPGLYGDSRVFQALNLGDALPAMQPAAAMPASIDTKDYAPSAERSLKKMLLQIFIWLVLIDTVVTLGLRGLISLPRRRVAVAAAAGLLLLCLTSPAAAQPSRADLVSEIHLAYIETGDQQTDTISHNGLTALMNVISSRTNIKVKGVQAVNPATDQLSYYPLIYWPMSDAQTALTAAAARNIRNYMAQGGMILIDTRDQQFAGDDGVVANSTPGLRRLRKLTEDVPLAELMPVSEGHILTKSFYLLDDFPGLYAGGRLWVEKEPSPNFDSVTSVVIGGGDWAAAWSLEPQDMSRFTPQPGGERQREMAYRFGVNIAMVALAGSYKADQVHVPFILERLNP